MERTMVSEWKDDRMKGLPNHGCALCATVQTKGAHRQCLCDLKATTHNVHSVPIISVHYMAQRLTVECCLTGLAPTSCRGQRFIATFLPGSKALCAHTSSWSLWQRQGLYYLPRHNARIWTSNTFLWIDGSIMQNRALFRSIPWAPLFMTCFFILRVKEEVGAPSRALTNYQSSNQRRAQSSLLLLWFDVHYRESFYQGVGFL